MNADAHKLSVAEERDKRPAFDIEAAKATLNREAKMIFQSIWVDDFRRKQITMERSGTELNLIPKKMTIRCYIPYDDFDCAESSE